MASSAQKTAHINAQRQAIRNYIASLDELARLKREFDAQNFNHPTLGILDADFIGSNSDMTAVTFKAGVNGAAEFNTIFTLGGTVAVNTDKKLYLLI